MLSHVIQHGVLVITVHTDPGIGQRAALSKEISDLVHLHRPAPVVIVLEEQAAGSAAVSAVLRAHRMCNHLGVLMSVATHSAPARRLLESNADTTGTRLVIHARTDTAISTAFTAAA
ncbi:hypothetical protein ACIQ7Q_21535 [Streptomyces sp. NPDC096176]|uniref:hypothetical protein n=1 Tax=Streptomyces sp. NPDC096176 TaxID=3366079 RepID=UPI00382F8922